MWTGQRPTLVPSGIWIHPAVWPQQTWAEKCGAAVPVFGEGELAFHLTHSPGPRPTSLPSGILIHPAVWPQQTWTENWGLYPFGGGKAGSPSDTMWPGPRPTSMPGFNRLAIIHQRHRQTGQTDRQTDNGPIA